MNNILDGILSNLGQQGVEKIAAKAGVSPDIAKGLMKQVGPVILAKMGRNAESSEELSSLDTAIAKDHDGSIFNNIDDLVSSDVDTKGGKILGHIFGGSESVVTKAISEKSDISEDQGSSLMEMMAPLVLGQLGKMKSDSNGGFDMAMLQQVLGKERDAADADKGNLLMGAAKMFLDKDKDGSITDDLLDIAKGFLK